MKNSHSIFTKSRMGLDNRVWLSMIVVLIIAVSICGFKAITNVNCESFEISTTGIRQQTNNIFYVGETITFSVSVQSNDKLTWDFGDGTPLQPGGKTIQHSFLKEGNFTITCILNNKCEQTILVGIVPTPTKPTATSTTSFTGDAIIGIDTVYVGITAHFSTPITAKYSYQWSVQTAPDMPVVTTAGADFTFYKEGLQTLGLKIDGNKSYSKSIVVLNKRSVAASKNSDGDIPALKPFPIPPSVTSILPSSGGSGTNVTITGNFLLGAKFVSVGGIEAKIISVSQTQLSVIVGEGATGNVVVTTENGTFSFSNPPFTYIASKPLSPPSTLSSSSSAALPAKHKIGITDNQLKVMLEQVISNTKHAQDFDNYFCAGVNTKVYVNTESKPISFSDLCQRLVGKKIKIESASIIRDPENPDCESNLNVKYKKTSGFLGL
jgi:PKD domain